MPLKRQVEINTPSPGSIPKTCKICLSEKVLIRLILVSLSLAFFLLFNSGCGKELDSWNRIQKEGILRVGLDPTFPPFEATDGTNLYGIDVDLAEALADRLDLEPEYIYFGYDGLYDALFTTQVDVLISALAIFPERTRDFAYSQPYFDAGQVVVYNQSNPSPDLEDLGEYSVAVELGSQGHILARDWQRQYPGLDILTFNSSKEAIDAAIAGLTDFAVSDSISVWSTIQSESYSAVTEFVTNEPFALVVRSEDKILLEKVNEVLADLKRSGRLDEIISSWLGP